MADDDEDDLFDDETNVLSTPEVSEGMGISEPDLRSWAHEHGVRRIGNAFAWSREDVDELANDFEPDEDDDDQVRRVYVEGELDESEVDDDYEDEDEDDYED